MNIEKGSKKHKVCFADEKPNGMTSGVILIKTYNVESYKKYNKLDSGVKAAEPNKNGKEVYTTVADKSEDSGEIACSCNIF